MTYKLKIKIILFCKLILFTVILPLMTGCHYKPGANVTKSELEPAIEPDYSGITIPPNIAPLNFIIKESGKSFVARFSAASSASFDVSSHDGKIIIPLTKWKKMLSANRGKTYQLEIFSRGDKGEWIKFKPLINTIANEKTDPYLYYRLLYPGYESWSELSINIRNLENFSTKALIENTAVDENCINCHSFNNGRTDDFLFHMRGNLGGTYFYSGGKFKKVNLKTKEMKNGAVYPRWHPAGKFVAFSSNKIIQRFHAADNKKVEVGDLESSLVLYDIEKNEMMNVNLEGKENFMDTFPEWSPDGKYLYFCRAPQIGKDYDYTMIRYSLWRSSFDSSSRSFGPAELVFDAASSSKSVAFPRISPDGKYLVLTVFDYGTFPIWHKEADLYSIDMATLNINRLSLNSDFADSYHSWSSNSKWLVFSSKRIDGLSARPYLSYINSDGSSEKPFLLPQEDPGFYGTFLKSFNIPEFSTEKIDLNPGIIRRLANSKPLQAGWNPGSPTTR